MYDLQQTDQRPFTPIVQRPAAARLRPTSQPLYLARLLFEQGDRHVTAEQLHSEAQAARIAVSLATVYNTLHQFTAAGLLRELVIESGRSYFDTNVTNHHHFFFEENGALVNIPGENVSLASVPTPPDGARISRVDVVVRVTRAR